MKMSMNVYFKSGEMKSFVEDIRVETKNGTELKSLKEVSLVEFMNWLQFNLSETVDGEEVNGITEVRLIVEDDRTYDFHILEAQEMMRIDDEVSASMYEKGYIEGEKVGKREGYEKGYNEGYSVGWSTGYDDKDFECEE